MYLVTPFITALFCLVTTSLAAQSQEFYLVLESSNKTIDGKALFACHEGAAIEGLCVGTAIDAKKPLISPFQFNNTKYSPNSGILTYELVGGNFKESEPMSLYTNPSTNVAIALFEPSDYTETYVSFDKDDYVYIASYYNDTHFPPKDLGTEQKLYRWFACEYNYGGYLYNTLCWVNGIAEPQNPTCQKVCVKRVWKK